MASHGGNVSDEASGAGDADVQNITCATAVMDETHHYGQDIFYVDNLDFFGCSVEIRAEEEDKDHSEIEDEEFLLFDYPEDVPVQDAMEIHEAGDDGLADPMKAKDTSFNEYLEYCMETSEDEVGR